jgi:hypothetical protein
VPPSGTFFIFDNPFRDAALAADNAASFSQRIDCTIIVVKYYLRGIRRAFVFEIESLVGFALSDDFGAHVLQLICSFISLLLSNVPCLSLSHLLLNKR